MSVQRGGVQLVGVVAGKNRASSCLGRGSGKLGQTKPERALNGLGHQPRKRRDQERENLGSVQDQCKPDKEPNCASYAVMSS
jgi:hypothetical protein